MGKTSSTDRGEYEFTRAAHDELQDAEKAYAVHFIVSLEPTEQRGVWALSVVACSEDGQDGLAYVSKWQGTWPNATSVSYGAFLYTACHRCVRMVEAWHSSKQEDESDHSRRG